MYKKQKTGWVKHLDFLIIDLICLEMAFLASFGIKFGDRALVSSIVKEYYVRLAIVLLLMDLCIVFLLEAYTGILRRNKVQELRAVIVHCSIVFAAVTVYLWGTKQSEIYSRQVIMVFWGLAIFFEYFARCAWKIYIRQKMIRGKRFSQLIVITEDRYATECVREFQRDRYKEFEVAGIIIVDKERIGEEIYGVPVVADADNGDSCSFYGLDEFVEAPAVARRHPVHLVHHQNALGQVDNALGAALRCRLEVRQRV